MRRDVRKPNYGGRYEATAGGSALKGENPLTCIRRELLEETGIASDEFEEISRSISHDTIYYNYLCVTDCDKSSIVLQEGETIEYKWLSEEDFIAFVNSDEIIRTQRERYRAYFVKMGYIQWHDDTCGVDTLKKDKESLKRLYEKGYKDGRKIEEFLYKLR